MSEPVRLRTDVLLALQRRLLAEHGGAEGVRDEGLLESALARPRQRHAYAPAGEPTDIVALAASYGFGLIKNHAFVDGNKRVAALATILFLEMNGHPFDAPEAEVVAAFAALAAGAMGEADFSAWLRAHVGRRQTDMTSKT